MDDIQRAVETTRIGLRKDVLLAVYNARAHLWHMVQAADLAGMTIAASAYVGGALPLGGLATALGIGGAFLVFTVMVLWLDERGLERGYRNLVRENESLKQRGP